MTTPMRRALAPRPARRLRRAAAGLLTAGLALAAPVAGGAGDLAVIATSAPLSDHSDAAIKDAVWKAVERAVRGAMAMGLAQVELRGARVLDDMVTVEIVATEVAATLPTDPP